MNDIIHAVQMAATDDLSRLNEIVSRSLRIKPVGDNPHEGWSHTLTWKFSDGETVTIDQYNHGQLIVPATAGYELLQFELPDEGDAAKHDIISHTRREPIVGWLLLYTKDDCESSVSPITAERMDGSRRYNLFRAIMFPDGRVEWRSPCNVPPVNKLYGPISSSIDEWVALVRQVWPAVVQHEEEARRQREDANKPCPHCGRSSTHVDDEIPF